ncbi:MAG: ISC system 2Fe-2S type ferredoxin [Buchnera aphidicola (Eriosoma harunire)]
MPKVTFIFYVMQEKKKKTINAKSGESILEIALNNRIHMEHACEKSCACSTCHCIIHSGFESLSNINEQEEDVLDKAWGVQQYSRLGCQARLGDKDVEIEIPFYTINHVNES